MVVKVTSPECVDFIRKSKFTNTETVERVLCSKLGIAPREFAPQNRGNKKIIELTTNIPVKITDSRLIRYISSQKSKKGISQRCTVEFAIIKYKKAHGFLNA